MQILILALISLISFGARASVPDNVSVGTIANSCLTQGRINETRRNFDIAISGEGWFPLLGSSGEIVFTRYGSFGMDHDGDLIHLPSGLPLVTIKNDGTPQTLNIAKHGSRSFLSDSTGRQAKLISMSFTHEGGLEGLYSDGQVFKIAKLSLAGFEKSNKLVLIDAKTHLFSAPSAVGDIAYGDAESAPFGKIFARSLEEVPVDRYSKKCD